MPTKPTTLEQYLSGLSEEQRDTIEAMRAAIIAAAPKAEAVFSYNMPGFKLAGQPLAWVAAWKKHYSIYPLTQAMVSAAGADLEQYEMAKGTLRFPAGQRVPIGLVRKLAKARATEIIARA